MQGARLVSTPAMKRIGSAVTGLDDKRSEIPVKSKFNLEKGKPQKKNYQPAGASW